MKRLIEIFILIGLAVWILVGMAVLYRYGIIERYQIGGSDEAVLVSNTLTGKGWVCTRDGCINAEQDRKNREDMLQFEIKAEELRHLGREELEIK